MNDRMTTTKTASSATAVVTLSQLPKLGAELAGGIFAGIVTRKDGVHCAVVLLGDKPDKRLPWKKALAWAESIEAELPTRPVAALLFANLPEQFEKVWHWTSEELDGEYAWSQGFDSGGQDYDLKSYEGRAVAVRMIPLGS